MCSYAVRSNIIPFGIYTLHIHMFIYWIFIKTASYSKCDTLFFGKFGIHSNQSVFFPTILAWHGLHVLRSCRAAGCCVFVERRFLDVYGPLGKASTTVTSWWCLKRGQRLSNGWAQDYPEQVVTIISHLFNEMCFSATHFCGKVSWLGHSVFPERV